ncbi:MAG: hypothetical protein BGO29_04355 [Bacteroidales bacterium 36-12]|nr:MAG: hypothetical protein BGO29_04355 [Bacteroidales bacterium 36-12]
MNKIITTVIIDDQKGSIETLKKDLNTYCDVKVIDTCTSVFKGRETVLSFRPSLLFIDIEMPNMSGFEFLKEIQNMIDWQMSIVFHSAFDKYILEAFRSSATDFLLKPYQKEELDEILKRVRHKQCNSQDNLANQLLQLTNIHRKIAVQTVSGLSLFAKDEALFFERIDNVWQVVLTNGQKYSLKPGTSHRDITKIAMSFILVNPAYIINIDHVLGIANKSLRCQFCPPFDEVHDDIFVSRRNYPKIRNMLDVL